MHDCQHKLLFFIQAMNGLNCAAASQKKHARQLATLCRFIVAAVTLYDMEILKQNQRTVDQLCTTACIREFSLQYWLGRLEDVKRYIEKVQQFHN